MLNCNNSLLDLCYVKDSLTSSLKSWMITENGAGL